MQEYDNTKHKSWLIYQDCSYIYFNFSWIYNYNFMIFLGNNLYRWLMFQYMPYRGFKWTEPTLDGITNLDEIAPIGRIYEIDITYPKLIHDNHNNLPTKQQCTRRINSLKVNGNIWVERAICNTLPKSTRGDREWINCRKNKYLKVK